MNPCVWCSVSSGYSARFHQLLFASLLTGMVLSGGGWGGCPPESPVLVEPSAQCTPAAPVRGRVPRPPGVSVAHTRVLLRSSGCPRLTSLTRAPDSAFYHSPAIFPPHLSSCFPFFFPTSPGAGERPTFLQRLPFYELLFHSDEPHGFSTPGRRSIFSVIWKNFWVWPV